MLTHLQIRNLAVLDEVDVDFQAGFTALTGETGAGKSMLVDALSLVLGERADSSAVRQGTQRAEICAAFSVHHRPDLLAWLKDHDLDADGEVLMRRVVTAEGRSRAYINGQSVPVDALKELGEQLVDICGQHAHQSLLQRSAQRGILDQYGQHGTLLQATQRAYQDWQAVETERSALTDQARHLEAHRSLLTHQLSEFEALQLQAGEFAQLEAEHRLHANFGKLAQGLAAVLLRIYEDDNQSAEDAVSAAEHELTGLAGLDPTLESAVSALAQAGIHIREAAETVRRRLQNLEHDPARQEEVEGRLTAARALARKHGVSPEELIHRHQQMTLELQTLAQSGERLQELAERSEHLWQTLQGATQALSKARTRGAARLTRAVKAKLATFGMGETVFEVVVDSPSSLPPGPQGCDRVEFLVSTGPGQTPGPIAKVASGGELSRLSLAIQVVCLSGHGSPTLVFDEVDAGIGGGVAEIVGAGLHSLAKHRQVLCVTHLPQVASQADHQVAIRKWQDQQSSRTQVTKLQAPERVEEIARMLGGLTITARTRAHAREMLGEMLGEKKTRRASS